MQQQKENATSYPLSARLQTEKPNWKTKKILYKQSLATDPKSPSPVYLFSAS